MSLNVIGNNLLDKARCSTDGMSLSLSTNNNYLTCLSTNNNYWKTRLRSRMAANRCKSSIGIGDDGKVRKETSKIIKPRRCVSIAAMNATHTSSIMISREKSTPIFSAQFTKKLQRLGSNPKTENKRTNVIIKVENIKDVNALRVPSTSLPLDAFIFASSLASFNCEKNRGSRSQHLNSCSSCITPFLSNFNFALHTLIKRAQTVCDLLKCFNQNLKNLRILVNLLLILAIFSQTSETAFLKTNCKKVGYQHIIDEPDCDLVAVYVNRCSGYCTSFSFPDPHQDNKMIAFAKCCRMTDVELIEVKVNCGIDSGVRTVKIPSARECKCYDCSA